MKRLSKLLVLVLTLALLCGVVFAVASSAADAASNPWASEAVEGVTGAERLHRDFTGESFDYYMVADGTNAPAKQLKTPPVNLLNFMNKKTGHLFSASDVKGNDYAEYVVHVDRTDKTSNDDAIVGVHPNSGITVNNLSYVTFEFDLMTPTDFPENIRLMFETRNFNGNDEYKDKGQYRLRYPFATYNKSAGAWEFDNGTLSLDKGEWAHITLVFQINKTETDEGVNYKDSVAKAYVNGELMSTVTTVFGDVAIPKEINTKIHYCGIGWGFENAMTGTKANDGAAIDNLVYTTYTDAYAQDVDNANLPALFEEEDPITDVTDLGPEIVWSEDYTLPARSGNVSVIDPADGTEYGAEEDVGITTLEDAMAFIKENEMTSATLKLYANQYNPLVIDFPVELTVDFNGYQLHNAYEVPDTTLCVEIDANTIIVSSDPAKTVTINYYDLPKGQASAPALVQTLAKGRELTFKIGEVVARSLVNGKNVNAPLATYKIYDEEGNEVSSLPDTVTDDLSGKTYSVYFDYTTKTFENEIQFSVNIGGVVTYYDSSSDLWAAGVTTKAAATEKGEVTETTAADGTVTKTWTEVRYFDYSVIPAGAIITLYKDCTVSAPLASESGNIYIDLNGHKLSTSSQFFTANVKSQATYTVTQVGSAEATSKVTANAYVTTGNKAFVYSSREGASMQTNGRVINAETGINPSNSVAYYFGYKDANTASEYRFDITFGDKVFNLAKGDLRYVYFQNVDLHNTVYTSTGIISVQQCRGLDAYFTDVNIYTKSPLAGALGNDGKKTFTFVRTNVYAEGNVKMSYVDPAQGKDGQFIYGDTKFDLTESKIFGMSFGMTAGDADMGENKDATFTVVINDEISKISAINPSRVILNGVSGKMVAMPETVTVGGKTYATIYGVGTGAEPTARFEIYDVSFEQYTEAMTPFTSMDVVEGYWFGCCETPVGESFYDFAVDPYNILTPVRYAVVDENGNELTTGAAVAGETYKAFVVYGKTPVSIAVIDANGKATPYFDNNLGAAPISAGSTVVLLSDDAYYLTKALQWKNVALDLNGKTLYLTEKVNTFNTLANGNIYIYSSSEGAKFYQAKLPSTEANNCGYVAQIANENSNLYFGYKDADTVSPYSIDVHCGAFFELKSKNSNVYLAKLNIYKIAGDNYGFFNIRKESYDSRNIYVDECNIFISSGNVIHLRESTNNGVAVFKNTNFYFNSSGGFVSYDQNATTPALNITFENVGIYGNIAGVGKVPAGATLTFNIKGNFTAPFTSDKFVLEEGKTLVAYGTTKLLEGHVACKDGVYGAEDTVYFQGIYSSKYSIGTVDEFKALAFQNMSLDTNVVVNLYVPAGSVISAKIGETEILDKTKTETINSQVYYVLSYGVAPKNGDKIATITVTLADGSTVDFEVSVARYATQLLGLEAEEGSYVADAKNLMKYILTYIKEVAVKYGGADEETIFAELGDFTVDTDVEITESVQDTTAIKPYVTHAALDLDAYAGFAFKVAESFVGTVKLELAGVPAVEKTYTAEAPAGANEVIVLENVPAHIFRGDVVITVTPAEGAAVQASFNLATYAAIYDEAYVKALYAYSIAAKEYNAKYPTVGTAN